MDGDARTDHEWSGVASPATSAMDRARDRYPTLGDADLRPLVYLALGDAAMIAGDGRDLRPVFDRLLDREVARWERDRVRRGQ